MTREPASASSGAAALLLTPLGLLYVLFLIAPVSYFLAVSFLKYSPSQLYSATPTLENYGRLLFDRFYAGIILDTFRIAATVTLITAVLAYAMAFELARVGSFWRSLMIFAAVAPLILGVIARSYGWIVLLGQNGLVNRTLMGLGLTSAPITFIGTEGTVIVALVHFMIPYMLFPIFSALASQDRHLVAAASTLGARPLRAFLEVTLPLSKPGLMMGSALVFTLTAGSVVTPALLGGRKVAMLGQTIYELVMSTFNWPLGAAGACLLVLCQLLVMLLYLGGLVVQAETGTLPARALGRPIRRAAVELSGVGRAALSLAVTLLYAFLLSPIIVVIWSSFSPTTSDAYSWSEASLRWYREFLAADNFTTALTFSLWLAAVTTVCATLIGFISAYGILRYLGRRKQTGQSLAMLPMMIPHILISLSLLLLLTRLPLPELSALIIGHVLICLPFTIAGIIASLEGVDPDLEAAASTLGASRLRVLLEVTVPLVAPGVLSALIFAFIVSFGDVDIALFLSGPGMTTLPIEIFSFIQWESSPVVAAITTVQIALVLIFGLLVERLVGLKTAMRL